MEEKKALVTLHYTLCFGVMLMILVLHFFMYRINLEGVTDKIGLLEICGLALAVMGLLGGNFLFQKRLQSIGTREITSENLLEFRSAYVMKWAFLDGAILINMILYFFVSQHSLLIVVALLLLLILFISKPKFH